MGSRLLLLAVAAALIAGSAEARIGGQPSPPQPPPPNDIPPNFQPAEQGFDFVRREVMIPMRDGVRLHTILMIPKGAQGAPILLTRTPYGASSAAARGQSSHLAVMTAPGFQLPLAAGYVLAYQDVRGKYGSEGAYVMNRPLAGPLNPTKVDHATDTWDTIDWLVKNVPESNGKVGLIGTSYGGFLTLMGTIDPHPALKVAVSIAPMVDTWRGDDWFHNGAFRQAYALDYAYAQTSARDDATLWRDSYDDYAAFLAAGSAHELARHYGAADLPFWKRLEAHPAYDAYWQDQALDKILAARPLQVPVLHIHGLWDQEDIYGSPAAYKALEPKDTANDRNFLLIGPWRHGGGNADGSALGSLKFAGDTGAQSRAEVVQPLLDQYLKDGAPAAAIAPVTAYETGSNRWRRYPAWPPANVTPRALYLQPGGGLAFAPAQGGPAYDEYVSDPAKPVPYRAGPARPVYADGSSWGRWLVDDQRDAGRRTDVATFVTAPLTAPLTISGAPVVHLTASTSGTDSDWVVKLIDVYPAEVPGQPELGGYQLAIGMDIFRGRYRESLSDPRPLKPGAALGYQFVLPQANHVFLPGHRIMVQVQSSWFPLYDRNPQTFVPNIFLARPADYVKATQRIYHAPEAQSFIELPVAGG